jgi:hypothetical protein
MASLLLVSGISVPPAAPVEVKTTAYAILDDFDMDQCTNEHGVGVNVDSHFME